MKAERLNQALKRNKDWFADDGVIDGDEMKESISRYQSVTGHSNTDDHDIPAVCFAKKHNPRFLLQDEQRNSNHN